MIDDFVGELRDEISAQIKYSIMGFSQGNKLALGGVAGSGGGTGSPIAGIVGQLAQRYITYDTSEEATASGNTSLVDNLNHMRYRLHVLESTPAVGTFIDLTDTPETYTGYGKYYLAVKESEDGVEFIPITAGGGGNSNPIFKAEGYIDVASGIDIAYLCTTSGTINNISTYVETVSGTLILDVNKNMTTIFTTQENRPTITEAGVDASLTPDITTFVSGDIFTVDIDAVGEASNLIAVINLTTASGVSELVYWNDVLSKPETFAPSAHTHLWAEITDPPATYTPASHTHTESEITDLDHDAVKLQGINISTDTPISGELLTYDGTNWIPSGITLTTDFLSLTDTPSSYSVQAGKYLVVSSGENSVEFDSLPIALNGDVYSGIQNTNIISTEALFNNGIMENSLLLPGLFSHYENSFGLNTWYNKANNEHNITISGGVIPQVTSGIYCIYADPSCNITDWSTDFPYISPNNNHELSIIIWTKLPTAESIASGEYYLLYKQLEYEIFVYKQYHPSFGHLMSINGNIYNSTDNYLNSVSLYQTGYNGEWLMLWLTWKNGYGGSVGIRGTSISKQNEVIYTPILLNSDNPRITSIGRKAASAASYGEETNTYTSSNYLSCHIADIKILNHYMTVDEMNRVFQYTRGKYGV